MLSTSKWLVGSSSSNTSGLTTNARASKTRLFRPPDRSARRSVGFSPMLSSKVRAFRSKSQPCKASISCCTSVIRSQAVMSPTPHLSDRSWYWRSRVATFSSPFMTMSSKVPSSFGTSWASMATRKPSAMIISPSSGACVPSMSLKSVDLPSPFRPIRHTRSPVSRLKLTWSKTGATPKAREIFFR